MPYGIGIARLAILGPEYGIPSDVILDYIDVTHIYGSIYRCIEMIQYAGPIAYFIFVNNNVVNKWNNMNMIKR